MRSSPSLRTVASLLSLAIGLVVESQVALGQNVRTEPRGAPPAEERSAASTSPSGPEQPPAPAPPPGQEQTEDGQPLSDFLPEYEDYYANTRGRYPGQLRFFDPKIRVYFDEGSDNEGEVDIFRNGNLAPALEFASIYWARQWGGCRNKPPRGEDAEREDNGRVTMCQPRRRNNWRWGPSLGVGMTTSATDSTTDDSSSSAPSVVFSASLLFEIPLGDATNLTTLNARTWGFEIGYAQGYSADEMLSKQRDSAWYVGMTLKLPPK